MKCTIEFQDCGIPVGLFTEQIGLLEMTLGWASQGPDVKEKKTPARKRAVVKRAREERNTFPAEIDEAAIDKVGIFKNSRIRCVLGRPHCRFPKTRYYDPTHRPRRISFLRPKNTL